MALVKLPSRLPLWAYLAAGAAAFVVARAAGLGAGTADAPAGPETPATPAPDPTDPWDGFGGESGGFANQFPGSGSLPGVSGPNVGDFLGGPVPVYLADPDTGQPFTWPAPAPAPSPSPSPSPTPTPTPSPTTAVPAGPRPAGANSATAAAAGTYYTYSIVGGRAVRSGSLSTGGWGSGRGYPGVWSRTVGTSNVQLVQLLSGSSAGKYLGRFAPGISVKYL